MASPNSSTKGLLDKDLLPTLISERALYPADKWAERTVGRGEGVYATNQILWDIYADLSEERWLKEMTTYLFCRTERLRSLTKGGAGISEFAYIPTPGLKNGTRIKHKCELVHRGNIKSVLTEAPPDRSRELAWLIPYKNSVRETFLIFIFTFDPIHEVIVRTFNQKWEDCTNYWRECIAEQNLLPAGTPSTCLHAVTGLHEWMEIIRTDQTEEMPLTWKRHNVAPEEGSAAAANNLDIYYSNSVICYAWSTLEKQKGRDRARSLLQQELCKPVVLFDPIYGKISGAKEDKKKEVFSNLSAGESEREKVARNFWDNTILSAHEKGASDIHIEPSQKPGQSGCDLIISLRKNGQLDFHTRVPGELAFDYVRFALETSGIIRDEVKRPQDGRRSWRNPKTNVAIDLRISVTPVGAPIQKIVMRLLDTNKLKNGIGDLGLEDNELKLWEKALKLNQSLVLVSGATGSGKSTTLYAALLSIFERDNRRSIATIEDPVEYRLPMRATQSPVNEEKGITYGKLIKQAMRNDGDTFLIGEIRDRETAAAAVQLSLTGHQVLSSIHANNAVETVLRIIELGVDVTMLAETLRLVVAQKLIPTPCPVCSTLVPDTEIRRLLRKHGGEIRLETCGPKWERRYRTTAKWKDSRGCAQCNFTGTAGMMPVQEFLVIDNKNKAAVRNADMDALHASMVERDHPSMEETIWRMAWLGKISISQAGEYTDQIKNY
jgi:type II secretory ATPase GspE/PulE/Tfp pilus assembly ATPase PilB-like protein